MAKTKYVELGMSEGGKRGAWIINCPACDQHIHLWADVWTKTGDDETPTIRASVLTRGERDGQPHVCHSFITDGKIQYLDDCTHNLRGMTVDLPDVEW